MLYAERFRLVWTPLLKKRGQKMFQAVGVICPPALGSGGELTLTVGKQKVTAQPIDLIKYPTPVPTQDDEHMYLWLIPQPEAPVTCRITWKTPLGQTHKDALKIRPAQPSNVHVIFKTHLDLGYTHRLDEVIRLFRTEHMEKLLDNLDATADRKPGKRFVWTLSSWLLEQCLDPRHVKPEHLKRLEKHVRGGQVVWGLMPFTTHSEFFGREEICRSLYAARRLAERFGMDVPTGAKMTDVPAHTASLAMAFRAAGGRFFQIGTNPDCRPPKVPPLFWWKLPDGERMLTHYQGTYGTVLLPPPNWPYQEWPAVQMTNDNVGPQGLEVIQVVEWIEKHFDWPKCNTGRLEDFAEAVIKRHGHELPEVEKEFTDWWIHGIASQAAETATARVDKDRLPHAESLHTLLSLANGKPVDKRIGEAVTEAYQNLALYTEHTWGDHAADAREALPQGNRYTSDVFANDRTAPPVDRWEASWEDKAAFARKAREGAERVESSGLERLAAHLGGGKSETGIVLFNGLNWARGGVVRMADRGLPKGDFDLVDASTGSPVTYLRREGTLEFVSPRVPACGYLRLDVKPASKRKQPGLDADWHGAKLVLHSQGYTMQFHTKGGLARWHDRDRSSQWCSCEAEFPLGTYLYEMPGEERIRRFARKVHTNCGNICGDLTMGYFNRHDYAGVKDFGPVGGGKAKVTPEITPLYSRVVVEADCPVRKIKGRRSGDAKKYRTTFTHYRGHRDLHVRMELTGKRATYAAEAGYGFFPLAGEEPMVMIDRIFHTMQPGEDLAKGVNARHMAVHHGVRVELKHAGLNFYPLHTPLISFGKPGLYLYDEDRDLNGVLYAGLFNNGWGTNFAQWQSGDFCYDFVLRPSGNDDWDGGLHRGGAEVFRPLLATVVQGARGEPSGSWMEIDSDKVQLVAFKPAEFGSGLVLRLWNADVDPSVAEIRSSCFGKKTVLRRGDLLERPAGKAIDAKASGAFRVKLKPNEVMTLVIQAGT